MFTTSSDPVKVGLVASLNHPGGNVTGAVTLNVEVASKRLELLREMVPTASIIAVLVNPTNPNADAQSIQSKALQAAARTFGQQIVMVNAATESDIDAAFARIGDQGIGALLVNTDAFLFGRRNQTIELAKRYKVVAIFDRRRYVEVGGLMSYGGSVTDVYRLAGIYVCWIFEG